MHVPDRRLVPAYVHTTQVPVADILCCKPSELAFYPLPKLMIRRVGDHEAHSATRAVRRRIPLPPYFAGWLT